MYPFKSKKMTELEKSLAEKINLLKERIKRHPAYSRRKKDKKNREDFFAIFFLAALIGVIIFGSGWLAVALSGTILSLVIVELGLFLSVALSCSGEYLYNAFLGLRDVFVSQKIKNQNKDFDQMDNELLQLEKLATQKSFLMARIDNQLNYALQWLPSKFFSEDNTQFEELSLKEQIQRLAQTRRELPAYTRRKKDRQLSNEINEYWKYYLHGMIFLSAIVILTELFCSPLILLIPPTLMLLFIPIAIAIAFGPILASNIGRITYLFVRDLFSPKAIKAENKQLTQLEKALVKLIYLENQLEQTDKAILNKLEPVAVSMQNDEVNKVKEDFSEGSKSSHSEKKDSFKYGTMFSEVPADPMANTPLFMPSLTS